MTLVLFVICVAASAAGALAGFGGGVIIKPVLDAFGILSVSTVSFLSGCTVLGMSLVSLVKCRKDSVKLEFGTSTPLALGAAVGGLAGKELFEWVRHRYGDENVLGMVQALLLVITTILVFLYIYKKEQLPSMKIKNPALCLAIGLLLGGISSFLGIGGGPLNVAVLFFFFSMDVKAAARNSIYVILFSQSFSLVSAVINHTVPDFQTEHLVVMVSGGAFGAVLGAELSKKTDAKGLEKFLYGLVLLVIGINLYNLAVFAGMCR